MLCPHLSMACCITKYKIMLCRNIINQRSLFLHRNIIDHNSTENQAVCGEQSFQGHIHPSPSLWAIRDQTHSPPGHAEKPISLLLAAKGGSRCKGCWVGDQYSWSVVICRTCVAVWEAGLLSQPCAKNQRNCCQFWSSMAGWNCTIWGHTVPVSHQVISWSLSFLFEIHIGRHHLRCKTSLQW